MKYVEGFVTPVAIAKKEEFRKHSETVAGMIGEFGALRVVDCWGDDVPHGKLTDMYMAVKADAGETVCFSWIEWPSKAVRDEGMKKMMSDPRMQPDAIPMPFDAKRMIYGGFEALSDGRAFVNGTGPAENTELSITRLIPIPRAKLYRCWTEPELLKQWFCPRPWQTVAAEMDVRPGGYSRIQMRGPNGEQSNGNGVYLEVVPNEKLVWTDAYAAGWQPAAKPFMTGIITFEDEGGKTRYTARARHWSKEDRDTHEKMGFVPGWNAATDQLVELASRL